MAEYTAIVLTKFHSVYAEDPKAFLGSLLQKKVHKKSFFLSKDVSLMIPSEVGFPIFFDFKQAEFLFVNREKTDFNHADDGKCTLDIKRHYV